MFVIAFVTSQQMGSGPILAICDCGVVTGFQPFKLYCLHFLLFKLSSGTCKNAAKTRRNNFSYKMQSVCVISMVAIASEH